MMDLTLVIEKIFDSSSTEEILIGEARTTSSRISESDIRLITVIEALGPKLTSTEVQDRAKAMEFLAHVFTFLKSDFLTEKELSFIVTFLHDRLKDQHVVIPKVFLCALPIVRSKNLTEGSAGALLTQIFKEGNIQSHTHKHRGAVFLTFQYCLENRLEELKKLSSTDFVMNFLQSMDGEKDPRNLRILFNSIPIMLTHFHLGPFVEDFFEVLSCYFPIDFKPTALAPGLELITRGDLVQPLHTCLSQTRQFSKLLIPLLMEKLDSSIVDAKLDSLKVLEMCCERSYTAEDVNPFLATIWHALRREIFMGDNELVEIACVNFLRAAFRLLSTDAKILTSCVTMIYTECKHHLSEPELRLSQPTARILTAIAEGSAESCRLVLNLTIPLLYSQFSIKPNNSLRKGLLAIMITLVSTLRLYPSVKLTTVLPDWDEVMYMWFTLLTHADPDFPVLALDFFAKLLNNSVPGDGIDDLNEKSRTLLQEHLLAMIKRNGIPEEVRSSAIRTMSEVARSFGHEFNSTSVPVLLSLATSPDDNESTQGSALNALAECSSNLIVANSVLPALLKCVEKVESDIDEQILFCLSSIVERGCETSKDESAVKDFTNFMCSKLGALNTFWRLAVKCASTTSGDSSLAVTRIIRILVRSSNESDQQEIINTFWNDRVTGDLSAFIKDIPDLLLEALLSSVRPSVKIVQRNLLMEILWNKITTSTITSAELDFKPSPPSNLDEMAAIRLYAVLLNKTLDAEFTGLVKHVECGFDTLFHFGSSTQADASSESKGESLDSIGSLSISDGNETVQAASNQNHYKRITVLFATVVKSLAMRGISDLNKWTEKIVALLNHEKFGLLMSNEFSILLSDCPFSLNSKSFCNFRFLYRQRLFLEFVPKLVEAFRKCQPNSGGTRSNYMRALSSLLKHVPPAVLQIQIDNVFPLLVASLNIDSEMNQSPNQEILLSTLTALRDFFITQSEQMKATPKESGSGDTERSILVKYFDDLVPRLLILTQFKPSMDVRILALKCLQRCAKLPTHVILPMKPTVTACLMNSLDDPKRLVRKEAVIATNIWILVGAPGGL